MSNSAVAILVVICIVVIIGSWRRFSKALAEPINAKSYDMYKVEKASLKVYLVSGILFSIIYPLILFYSQSTTEGNSFLFLLGLFYVVEGLLSWHWQKTFATKLEVLSKSEIVQLESEIAQLEEAQKHKRGTRAYRKAKVAAWIVTCIFIVFCVYYGYTTVKSIF